MFERIKQSIDDRRWEPEPNDTRRVHLPTPTSTIFALVAACIACFCAIARAQEDASIARDPVALRAAPSSYASSSYARPAANAWSAPRENPADAAPLATAPQRSQGVYVDPNELTRNEKCFQKTFRAPSGADADLVGLFLLRMLSDELREQTKWRFDQKNQTITVYGPEKSIEICEKFLNDFSEPLFRAFLNDVDFVGVAGVAANSKAAKPSNDERTRDEKSDRTYYDPELNEIARVAYEAQGALAPNRKEYAVAAGAGNDAPTPSAERPTLLGAIQNSSTDRAQTFADSDLLLDVATYGCSPALCDRVAELVQTEFAADPGVAFKVDSKLGQITVVANRKTQREVRVYLAQFQVYPTRRAENEPDLRVATGAVTPVDGQDSDANPSVAAARALGVAPEIAQRQAPQGAIDDVYAPQYRKAVELKDMLLQLFGERLVRLPSDPNAPYSTRQVVVYRCVKRIASSDVAGESVEPRICDVAVNPERNQIALQGDSEMCAQMLVLLRAMDQPPLTNGNVRRFIPIRNGDPKKYRQIFEYDAKKSANARRNAQIRGLAQNVAEELTRGGFAALARDDRDAPIQARCASYFQALVEPTRRDQLELALNLGARRAASAEDAFAFLDLPDATLDRQEQWDRVRQVSYQEDLDVSNTQSAATNGFGGFGGDPRMRGVGVVQGFAPIVLPDIDVIIVDNATDAEYERIRQMIAQIEELAKIAEISTEIYNLEHVDCAMLHGVLTTLYTEMFATKQGRVVFYALQNPNALLVAGWGQAYADMKELIELFDQPIADGAGTFRIARLKYASADEIAALLTETFVAPQTTGSGGFAPRIRAFADVRTNSLLVQASPNDWEEIQKILLELDVNKADVKLVTKVVELKNSLAENTRQTIMNVILSAKQGTLDTSAAKFPILQLLSVDSTGRRLIESGVMMDVDIVADVFHNQLIVTAPEDCIEFMERLIELLDVAPKKAQIRFFQVRYGDASQILQTLQSLLATADNNLTAPTLPQADAEESFVPVRFAMDTRTNVIIAAAAPKELAIIDALIVALDVKDTAEREEVVVQLRNIQALVVAEAIDEYLAQKQTLETASEVLSNYQLYESQVIVIPESISNSIIVSASPEEMEKIIDMIKTFDQDPPQVQIQVLICEVTLSDQEEFGIESGLQNAASFDRSMITTTTSGSSTGTPGYDIIGGGGPGKNMSANVKPTNIAGQVLNNFAMGATDSTLGYGGFVLAASSRSVQLTLRALREKNKLQVLSRPQVTAMDNQQAFILVGQRVPRISGTTTTNYGVQMNTTDTPVGLILLVTPRVTKDGRVVMEIGAEKSSLGNDSDATPIYSQGSEVIKSKSIDTIQTMTAISARDGETVMLGGLLTSTKEKISRGVPYVSDIPVLGWLFRYDQEVESRKELLIVMTPRIMRSSNDFGEVMRVEMNKMHVDLDEAMSLNGNMGLYDPSCNQGYQTKKTRRLINDLVHPDKMDELEKIQPYSPNYDYRPRPIMDSTNDAAPSPASSGDSYMKRRYEPLRQRAVPQESKPETQTDTNVEFYIDDLSANDPQRAKSTNDARERETAEKVALRDPNAKPSGSRPDALGGSPTPNSSRLLSEQNAARLFATRDDANAQRANDLRASAARRNDASEEETTKKKPRGISAYRSDASKIESGNANERGNSRATLEDERGFIRGQTQKLDAAPKFYAPTKRLFYWIDFDRPAPYYEREESSNYHLFKWFRSGKNATQNAQAAL